MLKKYIIKQFQIYLLLHNLALKGVAFSLIRGLPFSTPLQVKCIQNVSKNIVVFEGLWPKNGAKTHDIWHSLTRGQLHVQPPCKRVDLPSYLPAKQQALIQKKIWLENFVKHLILKNQSFNQTDSPYFSKVTTYQVSNQKVKDKLDEMAQNALDNMFSCYNGRKTYATLVQDAYSYQGQHLRNLPPAMKSQLCQPENLAKSQLRVTLLFVCDLTS
ncbi:Hypothetical_protein [Hexamita inflata]|uniref:Hypothetical_protein n=1 Tax=Hexamita inflata TaxID=28002 RepID=A0AA86NA35_9EUKA|nr:Hypothetical protein HINF_LOCUS3534 [Hexamita inflata]